MAKGTQRQGLAEAPGALHPGRRKGLVASYSWASLRGVKRVTLGFILQVEGLVGRGSGKAVEDALQLASMWIALLPIDPVEKEPYYDLLPKDKEGIPRWWPLRETHATPAQIKHWFLRYPNCNIAIITGPPSRLAVLDIDGPTPSDLPELPDTVVEKTPREIGGYHYYFRIDGPQESHKYRWNEDGVDYNCELKADLVFAICTPSSFGGTSYRWLPGHSIFEREPAPLPPGLV